MSNLLDKLAEGDADLDTLQLGDLGVDIASLGWQLSEDGTAQEIVRENDRYSMNQEEREWMLTVLDSCRRIHATAMVRVYTCKKDQSNWDYIGLFGVAALVTEADLRMACAHFIRVVDLDGFNPNSSIMLQQELYPGFVYKVENNFFHTFEMSKYIAGLSFANETHAAQFYEKIQECMKISAADVVDVSVKKDDVETKEKTYRMVGDADWRTAGDVSAKVAMKYATGGITDGTEVSWKKKADLPPELAAILGNTPGSPRGPGSPRSPRQPPNKRDTIDLLSNPQTRKATTDTKDKGVIGDGVNHQWAKNKKALTQDDLLAKLEQAKREEAAAAAQAKKKGGGRFRVFSKNKK